MSTVEQLVRVGSLIERDWSNSKDYWSRVQQNNPTDHTVKKATKKSDQGQSHGWGADLASVLGVPTLLMVPVAIRAGHRMHLLLDEQHFVE